MNMFPVGIVNKQLKRFTFSLPTTLKSVIILGWKSLMKATGREIFGSVASVLQTLDFYVIQEGNTAGTTLDGR